LNDGRQLGSTFRNFGIGLNQRKLLESWSRVAGVGALFRQYSFIKYQKSPAIAGLFDGFDSVLANLLHSWCAVRSAFSNTHPWGAIRAAFGNAHSWSAIRTILGNEGAHCLFALLSFVHWRPGACAFQRKYAQAKRCEGRENEDFF
jgi:hypothetical protein